MKLTLDRIAPLRTALITAVIYGVLALLFSPLFVLIALTDEGMGAVGGVVLAIAFPLIYAVMGFLMMLLMCALYNFLVKYTGGIEMEFGGDELDAYASWKQPADESLRGS